MSSHTSFIVHSNVLTRLTSAFKTSAHANRALYVIAGFEMIVNVSISWQWKVLTFKGTHLIQRMTLLTLYICNIPIVRLVHI